MRTSIKTFYVAAIVAGLTLFGLPGEAKTVTVKKQSVPVPQVSTWLGKLYAGDGLDANAAFLDNPGGFDADSQCNLYIADSANNVIRKIAAATNVITTVAGTGDYDLLNGAFTKATFRAPEDIILGPTGEQYVLDKENNAIRRIKNGIVTTLLAGLHAPTGFALSGATFYISDTGQNRIVKYNITTRGNPTVVATVTSPSKLVIVGSTAYVLHGGSSSLAKVDLATGAVTDIVTGMQDVEGIAMYGSDVYFISGTNGTMNAIWKYVPSSAALTQIQNVPETEWYNHTSDLLFCGGRMYLLFRSGSSVFTADLDGANPVKIAGLHRWGDLNGVRSQAVLGRPTALVRSKDGKKIYILENQKIKVYNLQTNTLSFLAGYANDNYVDGVGDKARMSGTTAMALSPDGKTLYLADRNNNRIRALDIASAMMSTLTGAGPINNFNEVAGTYAEGQACPSEFNNGAAGCAYFNRPTGIAISPDGKTLYVADSFNQRIRTVNVKTGATALLVGSAAGWKDGVGAAAKLRRPNALLLSRDGKTLYVAELTNHTIRAVNLKTKKVTTLMGKGRPGYREGAFKDVVLSYPDTLALGPGNTLFLSEVGSQRIRQIDLTTKTTKLIAGSGKRGLQNGAAATAKFNNPRGLLQLAANTLLVADYYNDEIRAIVWK